MEHIGQGFVELVEKGITTGPEAETTVRTSLTPLLDAGADMIVLGCTHYPFLSDTIKKIASEVYPDRDIDIIDPAPAVARHLMEGMAVEGISSGDGFSIELHASGDPTTLKETYNRL